MQATHSASYPSGGTQSLTHNIPCQTLHKWSHHWAVWWMNIKSQTVDLNNTTRIDMHKRVHNGDIPMGMPRAFILVMKKCCKKTAFMVIEGQLRDDTLMRIWCLHQFLMDLWRYDYGRLHCLDCLECGIDQPEFLCHWAHRGKCEHSQVCEQRTGLKWTVSYQNLHGIGDLHIQQHLVVILLFSYIITRWWKEIFATCWFRAHDNKRCNIKNTSYEIMEMLQ